jgi:hypothetical protein
VSNRKIAAGIAGGFAAIALVMGSPGIVRAAEAASGDEAVQPAEEKSRGIQLSFSAGYFRPWDSADAGGFQLALSAAKALGQDRFWLGGEVEYRHSSVDVKRDFSPDYDSLLVRYIFQYHPWPKAALSPYLGIGSGLALHVVDRYARINGVKRRFRHPVSGGFSLLAILGAQTVISSDTPVSAFIETRFDTSSDIWKKKGANWQFDQVGGFFASAGLRWEF